MTDRTDKQRAVVDIPSPDHLDQALVVVRPFGWVALLSVVGVLLCFLIWGFVGEIPSRISGTGILTSQSGLTQVIAHGHGVVKKLHVSIGDIIDANTTVATVSAPTAELKLQNAIAHAEDIDSLYRFILRSAEVQRSYSLRTTTGQKSELSKKLTAQEQKIDQQKKKIAALRQLVERGLKTQVELFDELNALADLERGMIEVRTNFIQLESEATSAETKLRQQVMDYEEQLREAYRQIREIQLEYSLATEVKSAYKGRVVEVSTRAGAIVDAGTPIVEIEPIGDTEELTLSLFVPSSSGKRIQPRMEVLVSPSTFPSEEYGYVYGVVEQVGRYPIDERAIRARLDNQAVVAMVTQGEAKVEVVVRLVKDKNTPSGLLWTTRKGPEGHLTTGTICSGNVTVKKDPPIALVIPWIKKKIGMGEQR